MDKNMGRNVVNVGRIYGNFDNKMKSIISFFIKYFLNFIKINVNVENIYENYY